MELVRTTLISAGLYVLISLRTTAGENATEEKSLALATCLCQSKYPLGLCRLLKGDCGKAQRGRELQMAFEEINR